MRDEATGFQGTYDLRDETRYMLVLPDQEWRVQGVTT